MAHFEESEQETRLNDWELLERVRAGDRSAFTELLSRHEEHVLSALCHIVPDEHDREDAIQTAWLKALQNPGSYKTDQSFAWWFITVARHAAIDQYRKGHSYRHRTDSQSPADGEPFLQQLPTKEEPLIEEEDVRRVVYRAIGALDDHVRDAALLILVEGRTYEEVMKDLHVPKGTVASRVNAARSELRKNARLRRLLVSVA
jgi:RNA polymerase sigma-70 factor (ECF subfamily)